MRLPKPPTPERLEKSALAYLERFSTSRENLRRVLRRKLIRAEPDSRPELSAFIDRLVERLAAGGLVSDETYAEGRIAALRRQGASARGIAQKLRAKGVGRDLVAVHLEAEEDGADLAAARLFARRRRLGPYRAKDRALFRQKDMAAMGRAGFDYGTARAVVDAPSEIER